jgi:hypothetical protein
MRNLQLCCARGWRICDRLDAKPAVEVEIAGTQVDFRLPVPPSFSTAADAARANTFSRLTPVRALASVAAR